MPYRRVGTKVQVRKEHGWENVPGGKHATVEEAEAHLAALRINVEGKKGHDKKGHGE